MPTPPNSTPRHRFDLPKLNGGNWISIPSIFDDQKSACREKRQIVRSTRMADVTVRLQSHSQTGRVSDWTPVGLTLLDQPSNMIITKIESRTTGKNRPIVVLEDGELKHLRVFCPRLMNLNHVRGLIGKHHRHGPITVLGEATVRKQRGINHPNPGAAQAHAAHVRRNEADRPQSEEIPQIFDSKCGISVRVRRNV